MCPVLYKLYHASRNCRVRRGMFLLHLLHSIFTTDALNVVKIFLLSLCPGHLPVGFHRSCCSVVHTHSARLITLFVCPATGHHCAFRKAPFAHPLQELHDDQRPERQFGRELHDDHDRHTLSGEKEHRRMLVLLSGALSLSY